MSMKRFKGRPSSQGDYSEDRLPPVSKGRRFRFKLMVNPNNWSYEKVVDDDGERYEWLPSLNKMKIVGGCQGQRDLGRGRVDPSPAITYYTNKGFVVLNNSDHRLTDICGDNGYMYEYQTKRGRTAYCTLWEEPRAYGNSVVWVKDQNLKKLFQLHVRDKILDVDGPDDYYKQRRRFELERSISRIRKKVEDHPSLKPILDKKEEKVAAISKDLKSTSKKIDLLKSRLGKKKPSSSSRKSSKRKSKD